MPPTIYPLGRITPQLQARDLAGIFHESPTKTAGMGVPLFELQALPAGPEALPFGAQATGAEPGLEADLEAGHPGVSHPAPHCSGP